MFKTLHSEIVYKGRIFDVRQDQVEMPNGKTTFLDIVQHSGAVTLVPIDEQGRVWFVRQYRHPAGKSLLELPAGTLDPGEAPEEAARREIREEIGMAANRLQELGQFYMAPGYSTEFMHVYLATGLSPDPLQGDEDEFLSVEKIHLRNVFEMAAAGEILDGKTLAALLLMRPYYGEPGSTRTVE